MSTTPLTPESFRIQLEGALETLEQGERLYASLARQLSGPRWRRRLKELPGLLAQVRAHESALAEALARVERRARQEQWPEAHPVRGLLRALGERRARAESLARERLTGLSAWKDASLGEVLAELEARVLEPPVPPPEPPEEVFLDVDTRGVFPSAHFFSSVLGTGVIVSFHGAAPAWGLGLASLLFAGGLAVWWRQNPGRFWLTRERMVWRTRSGDGVEVRLSSLSANDVELRPVGDKPWGIEVRVRGARPLVLPPLRLAPAEWLTLLRALPQPEADASPVEDFVLIHGRLVSGYIDQHREETHGLLVLQPGSVAFLPARYSDSLGRWGELLTRVRRRSLQALDRFVWMAVDREGGRYFSPEEVHASPSTTDSGPGYRFILRSQAVLVGATHAPQEEAIARLLSQWRARLLRP